VTIPAGIGKGDVQADIISNDEQPVSLFCPTSFCSAHYDFGKTVRLTATPDAISLFTSWGGDCAGGTCGIEMTGNKEVTANFTRDYSFKNIRNSIPENSLDTAILNAAAGDEIRMLATELTIDSLVLKKALTLTGGWKAGHLLQTDVPTSLNGKLTIQDTDSVLKSTTVNGNISVQSGSLRVNGVTIKP